MSSDEPTRQEAAAILRRRIKDALNKRGWDSHADLARATGLSEKTLSSWISGPSPSDPTVGRLVKVASALGVSLDYLTGRAELPDGVSPNHYLIDWPIVHQVTESRSSEEVRALLDNPRKSLWVKIPANARIEPKHEAMELLKKFKANVKKLAPEIKIKVEND